VRLSFCKSLSRCSRSNVCIGADLVYVQFAQLNLCDPYAYLPPLLHLAIRCIVSSLISFFQVRSTHDGPPARYSARLCPPPVYPFHANSPATTGLCIAVRTKALVFSTRGSHPLVLALHFRADITQTGLSNCAPQVLMYTAASAFAPTSRKSLRPFLRKYKSLTACLFGQSYASRICAG
jgi:hypothetical protein